MQTIANPGFDIATVIVDHSFLARRIMCAASGSAKGVAKVVQGDTLTRSAQVIGEVSSAGLIVLAEPDEGSRNGLFNLIHLENQSPAVISMTSCKLPPPAWIVKMLLTVHSTGAINCPFKRSEGGAQ